MNSIEFWKYIQSNPTGVTLTSSITSDGTVTPKLYPTGKIQVEITQSTDGTAATATINTPIAFDVVGMSVFSCSDAAGKKVVTAYNDTTKIFSVSVATAEIGSPTSIDHSETSFALDDNDLTVVISGSSAGSAVVILDIVFT